MTLAKIELENMETSYDMTLILYKELWGNRETFWIECKLHRSSREGKIDSECFEKNSLYLI